MKNPLLLFFSSISTSITFNFVLLVLISTTTIALPNNIKIGDNGQAYSMVNVLIHY